MASSISYPIPIQSFFIIFFFITALAPRSPAKNPSTDLIALTLAHLLVDTQLLEVVWVEVQLLRKYGKDMAHHYNDIINVIIGKKQ